MDKVIEVIVNVWEKFKSGGEVDIVKGVLDIILSFVVLLDYFVGLVIKVFCSIIGIIFIY